LEVLLPVLFPLPVLVTVTVSAIDARFAATIGATLLAYTITDVVYKVNWGI
jgi:hypothetical protein